MCNEAFSAAYTATFPLKITDLYDYVAHHRTVSILLPAGWREYGYDVRDPDQGYQARAKLLAEHGFTEETWLPWALDEWQIMLKELRDAS